MEQTHSTTAQTTAAIIINGQQYTAEQIERTFEELSRIKEDLKETREELRDFQRWEYYDYKETVKNDVKTWLEDHKTPEELAEILTNRDESEQELNEELWTTDSVTGNGSGSYFFNSWKARHALLNNWDLYAEACQEFGGEPNHAESEESRDVTVRCYLLPQAITAALDELEEEQQENETNAQRERQAINEE